MRPIMNFTHSSSVFSDHYVDAILYGKPRCSYPKMTLKVAVDNILKKLWKTYVV